MKLFIANTTKQRHVFSYRMVESGRMRQYPIEPGSQMVVIDGTRGEIDSIIDHHTPYGLVDASKIDQARNFIGLAYSIDRPVPYAKIEKGLRDNDDHLNNDAYTRRQAATAALDSTLAESGIGYRGDVELSAEQQVNKLDPDAEQKINETISTKKSRKRVK